MALHEYIHIDKLLNALLISQGFCGFQAAASKKVIDQESVQSYFRPVVVFFICQAGNGVQLLQMLYALLRMLVALFLFLVYGFHLSLEVLHPCYHGVQRCQRAGRILTGKRGIAGFPEISLQMISVPFVGSLDQLEVLAGDF